MRGKHLILSILFLLIFSLCAATAAYGTELEDVQNQIDNKKQEIQNEEKEKIEVETEITALTEKINAMQDDIDDVQSDINDTQAKILVAQEKLDGLQEQMKKQNDSLNKRLRTMYMNNNTTFIEVLLNSESISELLVNLDMVKRIHKGDKEVLETLKKQHDAIETEKLNLDGLKASLESKQSDIESRKSSLEESKSVLDAKVQTIQMEKESLEKELGDLQAEAQKLTAQIQGMGSTGTYGGAMMWPVNGHVSCEYGYRYCPFHGYEIHSGIDISVGSGTPVHAASSGVVMQAYYNSSYGNMVLLDNGSGIYTLYAHNSKLLVSPGEKVSQGDVIAYSGSTGNSTGPHVHFEVRVNGQSVNPRKYLG